ncbi:MAG: IPT/TIG domain-containing protein, partial [Gemmataceae bacterium]
PRPHQDMHALGFYGGKVYLGTDGGLFRYTPNPGRLGGWEDLNTTGLDTLQVNSVAARNGNLILDASQDNGHARTLDGADGHPPTWTSMGGGDGVGIWFDPDAAGHANMAYAANQHGEVYRTDNVTTVGAGGWEQIARRDVNNVDFYTPFAITPDAADTRIARAWNNWFIESRNRGAAGSWTVYPVFQEMNWLAAIPLLAPLASIKYMTYAPYEDGAGAVKWGRVAWVVFGNEVLGGGERGHIYRWQVVGAGGYWQRVTDIVYEGNKLQPAKLVPDPKTPGTMFAVMDSTSGPQVFWTRDFGKTWEDITGSGASALPNIGVTTLLVDPRRDKNANPLTAYAGTEVGVYKGVFQDDVWSWSVLDENLPKVRVSDLQITGGGQDILIVGTYGRGVWRIDLDAMCSFDSELEALTGQDQTVSATANVELEAGVVAIFTDPNNTDLDPDLYECAIDWGDGETSAGTVVVNEDDTFSVLGDHTYTNAGTFTVSVKIANNNDQTIFVDSTANVSGDIAAAAEPLESDEVAQLSDAVIASFTDTYTGAAPEDYTVSIDWGDGNSSSGSVVANESGGFDVVASHEYGEPAWFPITVTIDSVRDGHAVVLTQATIADATITGSAADDATADEDSATEFTLATFTDDNPDSVAGDFSASIDWGDGSDPDEGTITQQEDGSYVVTGTHTYAGPGDYEASVFTSDAGGSYANTTLTITVDGIAPEITGLEPDIGSTDGGRVVVITGSNLERVTDVYFGATAASDFSLQGSDRLIAVAPAHSSGTVHITVSNETGTSATSSADEFVFEEPPVNSVPSSQTTDEDTNLVFSSSAGNQVSVSDSDSSVIEVTLAVSHGALTLFSTGGLTFSAGDGYGDATMKFHGSPTWVNYALNGMTYAPAADYNGSDTLHVLSDDLAGGADSDTVGITVSAVNDAPVITAPSYVNAYQNTSNSLGGAFSIADVDAGGFSIQITLTVSAGTLTLSTTSGLTFSTGDGTDDATVTFTGTLAAINAALDGMNYNAINTWYETLTIEVNDLGNSGLGGELTDSALVGIMIGP